MSDYFFVITLADGYQQGTVKGIHEQPPGETRQQAFESVLAYATQMGGFESPNILFFALEPNQLGGDA